MSCKNPTYERCVPPVRTTAEEDEIMQSGVIDVIFAEHPDHLTLAELVLLASWPDHGPRREDAIKRAVAELVGNGLLRIVDGLLVPTRPALCFYRLQSLV